MKHLTAPSQVLHRWKKGLQNGKMLLPVLKGLDLYLLSVSVLVKYCASVAYNIKHCWDFAMLASPKVDVTVNGGLFGNYVT